MNPELKAYLIQNGRRAIQLLILWAAYHYWLLPILIVLASHPHPILESLRVYMTHNVAAALTALGWFALGLVSTRPKLWPKAWQEVYEWLGNAIEASLPGRFNHPNTLASATTINTPGSSTTREVTVETAADPKP